MLFLALCIFMAYAGYKGWDWKTPIYAGLLLTPWLAVQHHLVMLWRSDVGVQRYPDPVEFAVDVALSLALNLAVWGILFSVARYFAPRQPVQS